MPIRFHIENVICTVQYSHVRCALSLRIAELLVLAIYMNRPMLFAEVTENEFIIERHLRNSHNRQYAITCNLRWAFSTSESGSMLY